MHPARRGHGVLPGGVSHPDDARARRRSAQPRGDDGAYLPAARQAIVPVPAADDPWGPSRGRRSGAGDSATRMGYMQDHAADAQSLRPWLFTVARHLSIDASRARRARPTEVIVNDPDALSDTHDHVDQLLIAVIMRRGLRALTADQRRVILEVFYYGRSAREAAQVIGIPEGTAKSRLFYALRALGAVTPDAAELA